MAFSRVTGQHTSGHFGVATSAMLTFPGAPATNDLVVFSVICNNSSGVITTVKDGNNNALSATTSSPFVAGGEIVAIFFHVVPGTPSASYTLSGIGGFTVDCAMQEYAGNATSSPLETDVTADNHASASTAINTPTITTTNDGDLLYFVNAPNAFAVSSVNAPLTVVDAITALGAAGDDIQSTHGAQSSNMTQAGAGGWIGIAAAFKAAGGGGFTPKFRRTLSQVGTGVGKRQVHGWSRGIILPRHKPLVAGPSLMPERLRRAA